MDDRRINVVLDRDQLAFVMRESARIGRPRTEVIRKALADLERRVSAQSRAEQSKWKRE